jgi:hypothetical protein
MKFDAEYLNNIQTPVDPIIKKILYSDLFKLRDYNNKGILGNNITLDLVKNYARYGELYLRKILNVSKLFAIEKMTKINNMNIHYNNFIFLDNSQQCEILREIRFIAEKVIPEQYGLRFRIACLELLYFFTILVNPSYNWVMVDFLSHCNKNHQYLVFE